ncbi:MCE family protein [Rhodococcus sp. NPDC058505]|uniref:MCE family protein n=1 Tax=unclassified Rhodococcus (in: high G+C Gram-positive bacteria) TaxID=192944 RepID=UPI00365C28D6
MRSKLVRVQLVAFILVAAVGLLYVGAKYVRLDNLLGFGQYTVKADFADSGGIFTNAEVTYRGVPVGRVGDLHLTADGVEVDLKLDNGAPQVPATARAVVANRSAIGEQYVDLQPSSEGGPYLQDGSTITRQDTSIPVPVEQVLSSVNSLVRSVPLDSLNTTVTELGRAFDGRGDDMQVLVDSLNSLTEAGIENLPQTLTLIRDSRTVLDTQSAQASSIRQFSADLNRISAQLRDSDPDLRRLIGTGTDASTEVGSLIDTAGPALSSDLHNLALVSESLGPRSIALNILLTFLPALAAGASTAAPGDGTLHQGLLLETNNPPPCTQGYEGTYEILDRMKRENPDFDPTRDEFPLNMQANCTTPLGSVTGVRSANRVVYADPDTPQPWDNKPKVAPDALNLNPIATQLATLMGITPR